MSLFKTFYLGILAGVYIAFGSCLAMTVGGACQVIVIIRRISFRRIALNESCLVLCSHSMLALHQPYARMLAPEQRKARRRKDCKRVRAC